MRTNFLLGFFAVLILWTGIISAQDMDTHPRPDWARPCTILNGQWRFSFDPQDTGLQDNWQNAHAYPQEITVPYPWQSRLSGVGDTTYKGAAWYEREVLIPESPGGSRLFIMFGAVDWMATVWVNGQKVAEHEGGYTPFEAEITGLAKPGDTIRLTVRAFDVTDPETPNGKQTGWYTQTGGIWQTVYLESRGESYLKKGHITPDIDKSEAVVDCEINCAKAGNHTITANIIDGKRRFEVVKDFACKPGSNSVQLVVPMEKVKLWTPDTPYLYPVKLDLARKGESGDSVNTYFGMRKVSRGVWGGSNHEYILLNNKPVYLRGALHQSFNPEGIHTHPDDDFIRKDYEKARELGLNMLRIHIKVDEPRALYWADRLGVMLLCDVPCFNKKTDRAKALWEATMRDMLQRDFNHPAIIQWVDFNETWGIGDVKYDEPTQKWVQSMYHLTKKLDPTRLVEDNSPCVYDHVETDVNSWHFYIDRFDSASKHIEEVVNKTFPGSEFNYAKGWKQGTAPLINSEYGGVGAGSGDRDVSWVFLFLTNLLRKYDKVCGYVYTELSDIEWEHNGFLNYDRSPKEFGYPAGISVADLQRDEFIVLDCPPYQKVQAGTKVSVPLTLSHWSDRKSVKLVMYADGATIDGRSWGKWIPLVERELTDLQPFRNNPAGSYDLVLPEYSGILNAVVEIHVDGKKYAANYCVLDVQGGKCWDTEDTFASSFAVNDFNAYGSDDSIAKAEVRPGKVYAHGAGYIEYKLRLPNGLRAKDIKDCRLVAEIGSKADTQRLDWPARRNPQDYPQTDGRAWPTNITVSLDGHAFKELTIRNDFADAMGVLSHEAGWQHGSCGEVVDIPIRGEALESLRDKAEWWRRYLPVLDNTVTLRFEVPVSATNVGGISLYGATMGAYPCDPTLVFKLAKGAHKPKDAVTAIKGKTEVSKVFIKRAPHGSIWRYAVNDPGQGWETPAFDDSPWKAGMGGFGTKDTPGANVGTKWKTNGPGDIWLRCHFDLPSSRKAGKLSLTFHHDEDIEIFVNGKLLLKEDGYLSDYKQIILDENQRKLFNFKGKNLIAVHCHQTSGGQYVDLGLTTTR